MKLILIRHGITEWNSSLRYQGWSDVPLSQQGKQQALQAAEALRDKRAIAVYSSDLIRAYETAQEVAKPHAMDASLVKELREVNFGDWEGCTYEELTQRDSHLVQAWSADPTNVAPPNGETLQEASERLTQFLIRINAYTTTDTAIIVTHGGPIRVLLCQFLEIPLNRFWQFQISPASITEIHVYTEGAVLMKLNDTSHLKDTAKAQS